jgi:phosphoketolase
MVSWKRKCLATVKRNIKFFGQIGCSRFDIAIDALQRVAPNDDVDINVHELITEYHHQIKQHSKYIEEFGQDPAHLTERPTFSE